MFLGPVYGRPTPVADLPSLFAGAAPDSNAIGGATPDGDVLDILDRISTKDLNGSVSFAENVIGYMKRLENNLLWSNIKVINLL